MLTLVERREKLDHVLNKITGVTIIISLNNHLKKLVDEHCTLLVRSVYKTVAIRTKCNTLVLNNKMNMLESYRRKTMLPCSSLSSKEK